MNLQSQYIHIVNIVKKLNLKKNEKKLMIWRMRWLNKSVAIINATLQLLDIYIYIYIEYAC